MEFLKLKNSFSLIDVRSENEFQSAHIPGAINIPLLNNEHRKIIGTLYKQQGREAAVLEGLRLVGPNFDSLFLKLREKIKENKIFIYCWRGGLRSNIMAWLIGLAGYQVYILKGGYKNYRQFIHLHLNENLPNCVVLGGKTGSGKTKILKTLSEQFQILDLEAIASHKGSAFGHLGNNEQPSQEMFENLLADIILQLDSTKLLIIENESRLIGKLKIPNPIFNLKLNSPMIEIEVKIQERISQILNDYGNFNHQELLESTLKLQKKLGGALCKEACNFLQNNELEKWVEILLQYYDKTYSYSESKRQGKKYTISFSHLLYTNSCEKLVKYIQMIDKNANA